LVHARSVTSKFGTRDLRWLQAQVDADAARVRTLPKHRYALPLDDAIRAQLAPRVQPYPKAVSVQRDRSTDSGARGPQAGGVTPSTLAAGTTREGTAHVRSGRSLSPEAPRVI
jgi:hypothetical protein